MEYPGRAERELAAALIDALPESAASVLSWRTSDLRPAAEHILYTALRAPARAGGGRGGTLRALARLGREAVPRRGTPGSAPIVTLVTQPVHARLFARVADELTARGVESLVLDAETRRRPPIEAPRISGRLRAFLRPVDLPALAAHAVATGARLGHVPRSWSAHVASERAASLVVALCRGIPLAALDAARVSAMVEHLQPRLIACFSESGLLARTVPAAAQPLGVHVVDLPHAEAADPWGSAGIGYDGVAVFGPRAAEAMRLGGVLPSRIAQIGPLQYDPLVAAGATEPQRSPRRLIFAAQPIDPARPHLRPDATRAVLQAALAATAALRPAELVVVPHPTQPAGPTELLTDLSIPDDVSLRIERERSLHELLPGSWLLLTGSSQSVFDAVVAGVPSITINPTGLPDPVTFAAERIAAGADSADEAAAAAARLADVESRSQAVDAARRALGGRIGPLDGRAAARAAEWMLSLLSPLESAGHEHP